MPISVRRKSGVPLYVQVKNQIEKLVRMGVWEEGARLPTERELASTLGISRNTVSAAYRQLERDGLLTSHQGRGTFVAQVGGLPEDRVERLQRVVDLALNETLEMGLSPEDFVRMAQARASERLEMLRLIKVCFIECNTEQLEYFSKELELGSGVTIVPLLMEELLTRPEEVRGRLQGVDLVVTTFFHLEEVKEHLSGFDVMGIALDPVVETIVRIARLPRRRRVGLVCLSRQFADRVRKSISNAGINHLELVVTTTRDEEELKRVLEGVQAVIASPGRCREVERLVPGGMEIIEFIYRPDAGSINLLRSVLLERKQQRWPASPVVPGQGRRGVGEGGKVGWRGQDAVQR